MKRAKTDPLIITFTGNILYILLMFAVVLAAIGQLGIQTTSLIAVIGAAGLAVGLALQGSLANFAAGVMVSCSGPIAWGTTSKGVAFPARSRKCRSSIPSSARLTIVG